MSSDTPAGGTPRGAEARPGRAPAAPAAVREVERKVRVPEDFVLPALEGVVPGVAQVRPGRAVTMVAAYHDTPDTRLIRWGATLRRRQGGGDEGWHLKLPVEGAGPGVRDELALPLDAGPVGEVPAAMQDVVRAFAREAPLVHVATVRTRRRPYALLDAAGREVAELVDDHVEVVEDGKVVRRFHEVEVEARRSEDAPEVLDTTVELLAAGGGTPGTEGKAAAALGARARGEPDVVEPTWPGPRDPAGAAVQAFVAHQVRRLLLQDVRVRRDMPDSVHQMRVAARRLRSALRTFAPLLEEEWARALRAELRWAATALGQVRDTEVMLARLEEHATALADDDAERALPVVEGWLRARLQEARAAALAELRSARHLRLLEDLVLAARAPRLRGRARKRAATVLPPLVDRARKGLTRAVARLEPDGPAVAWHRARILAKRARYAAEAVAPVLGTAAQAQGQALERVTDLLGDHHDAWVAQQLLRELASQPGVDGATGYALGLLDAAEVERERRDRREFERLWPEVRRTLKHHPL